MITTYRPSGYLAIRASSFSGRSIDSKPINVENGATYYEIDTGRTYRYDAENKKWYEKYNTISPKPPYIEEEYDSSSNLISSKMTGYLLVRDYIYYNCTTLSSISISEEVIKIGNNAFSGCSNLLNANMPNSITQIGGSAFKECSNLNLNSLPENLIEIKSSAFYNCKNLKITNIPASVDSLQASVFYGCTGLTTITFKGIPTNLQRSAFNGCTNITTINVPWAENEISGAPWGASNATINYNYMDV